MPDGTKSAADRLARSVARFRRFFSERVWTVQLEEVGRFRASLYRAGRILGATAIGFRDQNLTHRAAALTYFTILSIVPFLAFAFSVLKGFGVYDRFARETIRPFLRETFGQSPALLQGLETVMTFVERTDVSRLGVLGVLVLLYTSISLLSNVETALNALWHAKAKRPVVRQVTDYTTLLVVTPLFALVAIFLGAAARSSGVVRFLREDLRLGPVVDFFLGLSSLVLVGAALIAIYFILPNARVKFGSAMLGGVVAALLWQLALVLHVEFQVGVARYNALYSGFAAFPIFLVWAYVSWLIVLVGGQLSASHQMEHLTRQTLRARKVDQALRESLAIGVAAHVARDHLTGCPPPSVDTLADALAAPPPAVESVLDALVDGGVVIRTVGVKSLGHTPAQDVDAIRLAQVRNAVRVDPGASEMKADLAQSLGPPMAELLDALENAVARSPQNLTMRGLAQLLPRDRATPARDADVSRGPVPIIDAKQPEVPA